MTKLFGRNNYLTRGKIKFSGGMVTWFCSIRVGKIPIKIRMKYNIIIKFLFLLKQLFLTMLANIKVCLIKNYVNNSSLETFTVFVKHSNYFNIYTHILINKRKVALFRAHTHHICPSITHSASSALWIWNGSKYSL